MSGLNFLLFYCMINQKIIPVLNILLFFFVIIWCVQKYLNNGFQDLTDFIIPIVLIILFLYDLYSSKKGKDVSPPSLTSFKYNKITINRFAV